MREEDGICLLVFRVRRDGRSDGREDGMGYGISVVTSIIDLEGMIDAYLRLGTEGTEFHNARPKKRR